MQQNAFEESKSTWQESLENAGARMPFRCPRCGDHARFRSLSSLRAHLEYSHTFEDRSLRSTGGLFSPLKVGRGSSPQPQPQGTFGDGGSILKPRLSYLNFCEPEDPRPRRPLAGEAEWPADLGSSHASGESARDPAGKAMDSGTSFEAHVREKFNRMVEAVDKTIERRMETLSRQLSQKTAELLEVRAAYAQLSQKKQEVQRRERALNRQVDVAVEMIAVLQQRLTESEEELHRKEDLVLESAASGWLCVHQERKRADLRTETGRLLLLPLLFAATIPTELFCGPRREVVTFNHFLEEAAEKEVRGKARLERFIENLLQRVDQAEKQLEKYQNQQGSGDISEHLFTDLSSIKKPRCLWGYQHSFCSTPDPKPHSLQKGRVFLKKAKEDRISAHPVKWFYEPVDGSRDIWRPQKKADAGNNIVRKVNVKSKIGKKSKPLY